MASERYQRLKQARVAAGRCVNCNCPHNRDTVYCLACQQRRARRTRVQRTWKILRRFYEQCPCDTQQKGECDE